MLCSWAVGKERTLEGVGQEAVWGEGAGFDLGKKGLKCGFRIFQSNDVWGVRHRNVGSEVGPHSRESLGRRE